MKNSDYKIAIVSDPLFKAGGEEKHLKYMLETFPGSVLYTAFCDKKFVKEYYPGVVVKTSFMQYIPGKFKFRQFLLLLQPLAYKSFRFKDADIVLSISIAFAKFVKPRAPHVNICLTPSKYFWEKDGRTLKDANQLKGINKMLFKFYSFFMDTFLEDIWKKWDKQAAQRPEKMIAISHAVSDRIKKFYERESDVMYPPVEVKEIGESTKVNRKENWFLYLGRVETYKGVELAIRAAYDAKVPLKVAGTGEDLERMHALVKELNAKGLVKFLGFVSDEEKLKLLSKTKALIFPVRKEDFGIVPVEANAAGTPVIAYAQGGVLETISKSNPKTGIFFKKYGVESLSKILKTFDSKDYNPQNCKKNAENFAVEIFKYKLRTYIEDVLQSK
jgi:glycosyltransferase involved in cell wall biosynthesis